MEGSNILEPGQGGFRARRGCDINMHKLDFITRETQKTSSNPFVRIDVDFENGFNSVPHEASMFCAVHVVHHRPHLGLHPTTIHSSLLLTRENLIAEITIKCAEMG